MISPDVRTRASTGASLEEQAVALAMSYRSPAGQRYSGRKLLDTDELALSLSRARDRLRAGDPRDPADQKAGEWLLDNHYLAARALRQIDLDLPRGFRKRLPYASNDDVPRILRLAHTFVRATSLDMDETRLLAFVDAFQSVERLTIAEIWALPTMLRISALETLGQTLDVFFPSSETRPRWWAQILDPALGVERSIRALRLLAEIDWKAFFQRTSVVESVLSEDPSGVYRLMDFETRDSYRKQVETLALGSGRTEEDVARLAVELASARPDDSRSRHIGHFLIDRGRGEIEARIHFRARGRERLEALVRHHPTVAYLGAIATFTAFVLAPFVAWSFGALGEARAVVASVLASVPASAIAVAVANRLAAFVVRPRRLPKLDFSEGIPLEFRTVVAIPVLVGRCEDFDPLLEQLELHYLANSDPALEFALLSDRSDRVEQTDDTPLVDYARRALDALNARYAPTGRAPFHVLHRAARWNSSEGRFMGWERKRGKLEELNRLLRGDSETTYAYRLGSSESLSDVRFVITLDADTRLTLGAARRLVGTIAHPSNRAVFDESSGRVVDGYTIIQPRVETSPLAGATSWWSRIAGGDRVLDIYSLAVSDVYQDLFDEGVYIGKGIYDVDAFTRSLAGRVPENALASHDLFEGIHGRAALASDIVLFEDYPSNYLVHARRVHRWIRGDWQLVPWLLPSVPSAGERRIANVLSTIDRWKIVDNLRRSLFAPSMLAFTTFGLVACPEYAVVWASAPVLVGFALVSPFSSGARALDDLGRAAFALVVLPFEAALACDAIVRVIARLAFTRTHLLEWVTAAHVARSIGERGSRGPFMRAFGPVSVFASILAAATFVVSHTAFLAALPLLAVWLASPEIVRIASSTDVRPEAISAAERRILRRIARRTWLFYETFVGPRDQWLAPDNYQERPRAGVAHRTSPTNIGLGMLAVLSAFDFGYVGATELAAFVRHAFDSLDRMERYRGHLLNWYDTRTLEPLLPRYVSTVDSGNFIASMIALAEGCRRASTEAAVPNVRWEGLLDAVELFEETIASLRRPLASTRSLVESLRAAIVSRPDDVERTLAQITETYLPALDRWLADILDHAAEHGEVAALRDAGVWLARIRHQVGSMAADLGSDPASLHRDLLALAERADSERASTDFTFLFHRERKLFHIGYNATADRLDPHFYDLLASEARLASFLAIVHEQVDVAHWYTLGRPVARVRGGAALVSWGGTMFEYLMPRIFMRAGERTLLTRSEEGAVDAQIAYGAKTGTPWGISESGFAQIDGQKTYQYRSFGVPGLGLKRGLADDHVIAPYASMLAVGIRPSEVLANLASLRDLGAIGTYGLFEAIDFSPPHAEHAADVVHRGGDRFAIVRSYMAHHQGMILAALDNALNRDIHVERFHADGAVRSGELLLHERIPSLALVEDLDRRATTEVADARTDRAPEFPAWQPSRSSTNVEACVLTNGRLTTIVTDTGAGLTRFEDVAIVRGGFDPTCDEGGFFLYVHDEDTGRTWSATPAPTRARSPQDHVEFHAHKAEFHHRENGLSMRTTIAVAPLDDIEIRHVTLHNESETPRTITLTSFAEPVLESALAAERHPAFSRMFVECEVVAGDGSIVAWRRPRRPNEPGVFVVQRLVFDPTEVSLVGFQVDRGAFIGRRNDLATAAGRVRSIDAALSAPKSPLDPVMALASRVVLQPGMSVELSFATSVGTSRDQALELSRRFASPHALRWATHDARSEAGRRFGRSGLAPESAPDVLRLVSRILFRTPAFGAPQSAMFTEKHQLWGHGISGDDPIVVVRIRDDDDATLLHEVLGAYRLLRASRLPIELVLLDDSPTSYASEAVGSIRDALRKAGVGEWLGQRAGIFVLGTGVIGTDERARIESASSVWLDASIGGLRAQWDAVASPSAPLPRFEGGLAPEPPPLSGPEVPPMEFAHSLGGFANDGREYAITLTSGKATPAPWCNVIANAELGCLVSESSLGATWAVNSGENRLSPWHNDSTSDTPAEALYLRDEDTAEVWTPTPLPAGKSADVVVRHGAGYTTFSRNDHGLRQEMTVFVAPDAPVKVVRLELTNLLARRRRVTATYYVEWVLGAMVSEQARHVVTEFDASANCLLARCGWNPEFAQRVAFLTADRALHGFTCDRSEFLGRSGRRSRPAGLERWGLSHSTRPFVDPCAALMIHIELEAGQTIEHHFVLGQGRDRTHALELATRFSARTELDHAWATQNAAWDETLAAVEVKTPEPAIDLMLNRWLLYQSLSSRFFARSGHYQSSGAFGFRDQLQDSMAYVYSRPELTRSHIVESAAHQFEQGDVLHWWHPPAGRGVRTRCSDDLAWLVFVTAHYVGTTGDETVLREQAPFLRGPELSRDEHDRYGLFETTDTTESVYEHCRRAIERAFTEGPHGLPLIGDGDWNDGMNRVGIEGRGESIWLAWFLCATARSFADLCERMGENTEASRWRERADELGSRVDAVAWDGSWYVRAFYDDGAPMGSARSRSCHIDSIAQSWSVLSGAGDPDRVDIALRAAREHLVREREQLVLLLHPPFEGARHDPGYIKSYPPGVRENGGQYTHAAVWLGWAFAMRGDGETAERIFRLLTPVLRGRTDREIDRYRVEPYALAADICGAPPWTGRGGWTWYTGAAAWLWRFGVEAILGIKWRGTTLEIDPSIPAAWPSYEATVRLGRRSVHVLVDNGHGAGRGVTRLVFDGVAVLGNTVTLDPSTEGVHEIRVELGRLAIGAE